MEELVGVGDLISLINEDFLAFYIENAVFGIKAGFFATVIKKQCLI